MTELDTLAQRVTEIRRSELPDFVQPYPDQLRRSFQMSLNRICQDILEVIKDHQKREQNRPLRNPLATRTTEQLKTELEGLNGVDIYADRVTRFGPGQDRRHAHLAPRKREILAELKRRGIEA
jgi:hypothetical protein